jgi:hypothetical protein
MPHSTRRTCTPSQINVRNDVRILYIEHSSVWRYVEKTLCAFSAGGLKKGRSANSQMEENAHGECPGQLTGANIRGRSLNAALVVVGPKY